jgi:putative sterol carrier protein
MAETRRQRFFEGVAKQGHVRLLEGTSGTVLAEIKDGNKTEHWYVEIHRGDISVSHKGATPDCTIRTDGATFDDIISGKLSIMPALLRGLVEVEGKVNLLVGIQALYKPSAGAAKEVAGYARRHA